MGGIALWCFRGLNLSFFRHTLDPEPLLDVESLQKLLHELWRRRLEILKLIAEAEALKLAHKQQGLPTDFLDKLLADFNRRLDLLDRTIARVTQKLTHLGCTVPSSPELDPEPDPEPNLVHKGLILAGWLVVAYVLWRYGDDWFD